MKLNFKAFGQGEPIIILHGLFGTLDNWQTMARQLAKDYSVYIVDQRNHGRSPHVDEMDYPSMAEDLKIFMESQWIYEARIVGHSMGGKTAMQFALNYPEMVLQLVIVDIGPQEYKGDHEVIMNALESLDLNKIDDRKEADNVLKSQIDDVGVRQFLLKNLTRKKEGGYRWKMNLPVIRKNYNSILAAVEGDDSFEGDTLFIRGGKSNYIKDTDRQLIKEVFSGAQIKTIENAGHWVHAEAPKTLYDMLIEFFNDGA